LDDHAFARRYGPTALITGAAMGIGAAYAERFARMGLGLVLVDRDADALRAQEQHIGSRVAVRSVVADLADPIEVDRVLTAVADVEIGLFVANAAHAATAPWLQIPVEDKLRQIRVNCVAVTQMVDGLSRAMVARRRGGIIIMSSLAGRIGSPRVATYAATKAFDLILAESLWAELAPHGVDVLAVLPGQTHTPGFDGSLTPRSRLPKVRVMRPEEVVDTAVSALGAGPLVIAGRANRFASELLQRVMPRKRAIGVMTRSMRAMYPD